MKKTFFLFSLAFLSSCSPIYKKSFDCPIPEGTPCTSVTQIESMIVERDEGADLFVLTEKGCTCTSVNNKTENKRKIWFSSHETPNGVPVKGKNVLVEIR